jgi:hypothetical protein
MGPLSSLSQAKKASLLCAYIWLVWVSFQPQLPSSASSHAYLVVQSHHIDVDISLDGAGGGWGFKSFWGRLDPRQTGLTYPRFPKNSQNSPYFERGEKKKKKRSYYHHILLSAIDDGFRPLGFLISPLRATHCAFCPFKCAFFF